MTLEQDLLEKHAGANGTTNRMRNQMAGGTMNETMSDRRRHTLEINQLPSSGIKAKVHTKQILESRHAILEEDYPGLVLASSSPTN